MTELLPSRTLVLCFDGTSDEYSTTNTNIIKFFSLLKKDNFDEQLCYYQAGIGTFFEPGVVSPLLQWFAKVADEAFAWYLNAHVMDGYRFLMQNYRAGDRICIFGFSRGAYTARALGGMLHKVGLLPRDNEEQIPFAYKLYKREDATGIRLSAGFKQTFCHTVQIEFMGVWETVAGVGVIMNKNLPFTDSNRAVKTFRHALSLDEHRARFKPNLYHRAPDSPPGSDVENGLSAAYTKSDSEKRSILNVFKRNKKKKKSEMLYDEASSDPTDVLEVWFSGCHSDIGGGEIPNEDPRSLANVSLRWMIREILEAKCGISFLDGALDTMELNVAPESEPADDGSILIRSNDAVDALEPLHDQLKIDKLWWILEILPMKYTWQDEDCQWHSSFAWNLGRGRAIVQKRPSFHITVRARMRDTTLGYKPKARWDGQERYVA